jgi:hypothetical protein
MKDLFIITSSFVIQIIRSKSIIKDENKDEDVITQSQKKEIKKTKDQDQNDKEVIEDD